MEQATWDIAWDDVNGVDLDPELVKKARREEVEFYKTMGVYEKVPLSECFEVTGRPPVSVRWIDHNKGDKSRPLYRSRLVGQDYNNGKCEELFSSTQP